MPDMTISSAPAPPRGAEDAGSRLENRLRALGVVPVVTIGGAADAPGLADALCEGGLPVAEITFRTDAAAAAIAAIRKSHPDFLIGAGTVLDVPTLHRAIDAGATFVVAPGFNPAVVDSCRELGVPVIPGVSTPTEIEAALSRNLKLLKFFPAAAAGGLPFLSAVSAPYRGISFMPTGGINRGNLPTYLAKPFVAACGGSWIATETAIAEHRFDEIAGITREAVALAAPFTTEESTA